MQIFSFLAANRNGGMLRLIASRHDDDDDDDMQSYGGAGRQSIRRK